MDYPGVYEITILMIIY